MSEQEQQVEQQVEQPQQIERRRSGGNVFNQYSNNTSDSLGRMNKASSDYYNAQKEFLSEVGKTTVSKIGGDTIAEENTSGKVLIYIFWILCIIILIYIIVIAVWANSWFSSYVCKDETAEVKTYIYTDEEKKEHEYSATFQDNFMRALNVNKLIINCLFSVTALYGMIVFYLMGKGTRVAHGAGKNRNGEPIDLAICGGKNFAWYLIVLLGWFVLNCVWDMQHNTRYPAPVEGFCGMVETFCGNISESFSNMKKALRKF